MSLFRDPKTFVRRGSATAPTLRQFVRIVGPAAVSATAPDRGIAAAPATPVAVAVDPAGSTRTAPVPPAANEDQIETLSDSTRSAEA
jgi:hypothetical protein